MLSHPKRLPSVGSIFKLGIWQTCNAKTGDSLSCTSSQILNFFVMTKTLGALTRQRAVAQTLAG